MSLFLALILFLCSILQGAVGFGFGTVAIPSLYLIGISLRDAATYVLLGSFIQLVYGTYKLRAQIPWRQVIFASFFRFLFIPLGVLVLFKLNTMNVDFVRQFLGCFILIVLATQYFFKVESKEKISTVWGVLAFSVSGFFVGMISVGGPTVVLWTMAHSWQAQKIRAFMQAVFLVACPYGVYFLYRTFGSEIVPVVGSALIFSPLIFIGAIIGKRIGDQISTQKLKQFSYTLLFLLSLSLMFSPFI